MGKCWYTALLASPTPAKLMIGGRQAMHLTVNEDYVGSLPTLSASFVGLAIQQGSDGTSPTTKGLTYNTGVVPCQCPNG